MAVKKALLKITKDLSSQEHEASVEFLSKYAKAPGLQDDNADGQLESGSDRIHRTQEKSM